MFLEKWSTRGYAEGNYENLVEITRLYYNMKMIFPYNFSLTLT